MVENLPRGEALVRYEQDLCDFEALISSLSEQDLDVVPADGEWSARAIVHHLADGEAHWLVCIKMALLQDGYNFVHNSWRQAFSEESLAYKTRDVQPSLNLLRSIRVHVLQLLERLPKGWDRLVVFNTVGHEPTSQRVSVGDVVNMEIRHLAGHIEQIRENLRAS